MCAIKNLLVYLALPALFLFAAAHAEGQAWRQAASASGAGRTAAAGNPAASPAPAAADAALSPAQKLRADMLISVFENSSLELQYGYIENLHDGRGYTAGRAGFCSGCGDLLLVAERYTELKPDNPLAGYLPRLNRLAALASASTAGLDGFPAAWRQAARDELFRSAQDAVSDELYYLPALTYAGQLGLKKDFSKIALYEAAIQHGTGSDPDGLGAMIERASRAAKPPAAGGSERTWLGKFLKVRRAALAHPASAATGEAWAGSVGRADAMLAIYAAGNMDFSGPVALAPFGCQFVIPK
ncbi:MAG: chitosanase [Elusimicrobia bacterium]|nr:chitosanase [Elusimicrobiota bacterium]